MKADPPARRRTVVCDVACVEADAATVDALARLQLVARRHGLEITLVGASDELRRLIDLIGLAEALPEARSRAAEADRTAGTASRCRGRR